jgi:secreted trypsin-like serine protease
MAFVSKLLGAATAVIAFGSNASAETLASANAFACGVDAPNAYNSARPNASRAAYGYAGSGLDSEVPSMVKLRIVYEYPDRIEVDHCGGTVVDSQWIVTAAHCVAADSSWDRVEVIAGDINLDSGGVVRRVSRNAVCHSGFEFDGLKDDVALIRLDQPLPSHIPPAQIDQQSATSARRGSSALVAGWPVTGGRAGDRRLNKTQVQMTDVEVPGYVTVVAQSGGAEGVCRGESGGPLMTYGTYGLQLAGVLSGIQPGTENGQGEECMLSGYEMYFTPMAAFRSWMDNVRYLCSRNPALCKGSGSRGMMLANAPSYNGSTSGYQSAPAYVQAPAQPTYQSVSLQQPTYQPTYVPAQPTYVAQTQPTYVSVALAQPTYIDVTNQYQSYNGGYAVPTKPIYQDVSYTVALSQPAPAINYTTSNYVSIGSIDLGNSYAPVATQYQDYSYQPTQPTYIDQSPQYNHVGSYDSIYSVAYAQPVSAGSVFQLHAW